jgi:hypothetical protein
MERQIYSKEGNSKMKKCWQTDYVIYRFPDLTFLQRNYVQDLFTKIVDNISSEQSSSGVKLLNSYVDRIVYEMSLEQHDNIYYLVFCYIEPDPDSVSFNNSFHLVPNKNENSDDRSDIIVTREIIPIAKELRINIPVLIDADDSMSDLDIDEADDVGMTEDGENSVIFNLTLQLFTQTTDKTSQ